MSARYEALEGLLRTIDQAIEAAEPKEVAALSREKRQIMAELDSLAGSAKGSPIDELVRRREERRAATAVRASAGRGGQQRGGKRSG